MESNILRMLPSVEELMNTPEVAQLAEEHDRDLVVHAARSVIDSTRSEIIKSGQLDKAEEIVSLKSISSRVVSCVEAKFSPSLRWAINAAGIILHTGLGRAVMSEKAIEAVNDVIKGYCTLATDIEKGQRCSRDVHFSDLLCEITGAEAATAANNNAAATMLVLNTLAKGKEVIISRGQLVEIGGSFRMPDVMESSGAIMREVGTTNKTHLRDYAAAINENTGAILRVHMSNYRIVGFFEEPSIEDMAKLAREHGLPIIDDLGSGALFDLREFGLESEPMVRDSIKEGVDVACFSGDKLIGGPQAGIMVGKANVIRHIKKNPLARALRIGKMEVAALEATLRLFLEPGKLKQTHPTYRMLSLTVDEIQTRAQAVANHLLDSISDHAEISVIDGSSQVGSGSVPAEMMPTRLLGVRPISMSADALARKLRRSSPPIFARIHQEAVLFDFRTIQPNEDELVERALREILVTVTLD
ncbi:MAG: L-seryl-tRNA(Sec) selenium transferase [Armatimonadota bacterium]